MIPVLDLFSGVGAYSLGMERAGSFKTLAFCEINPYARRVLRRHWKDATIYKDVETLTGARLHADGIVPEWIVAGWPCQDISVAGTGSGLDGERSGLFSHIARLASETGSVGLLLENSANLLAINGGADFGEVLRTLAALGFDVVWHCLPAAGFDAPHIRDRLWIIAVVADANRPGCEERRRSESVRPQFNPAECGSETIPDATRSGCAGRGEAGQRALRQGGAQADRGRQAAAYTYSLEEIGPAIARAERHTWEPEPNVGRVVHGCPNRVDRIRALGNLNPPIIPETIARAILSTRRAA